MSAFHPAVYGALYVALADHKRYLAAAEAVADMYGAGDAIAEYTSAIAGLQEMIALLHAGDADAAVDDRLIAEADLGPMHCMLHNTPPIPPGEHCPECKADHAAVDEALAQDEDQPPAPKSREHAVMGQLLPMMADIPTASWQINTGKIDIQPGGVLPDGEVRPAMRAIAASLPGFDYCEVEYVHAPHVSVEAYAVIDGVKVRIWDHARPAAPARAVQDEDQSATPARGHGQDDEKHAMWPEGTETPRCGATGEVALFGFAVTCQKCLALMRAQMQDLLDEENEYGLDDDGPVTYAPTLDGSMPRCGAREDDPVYSNRPTCPTCRSLRPLKRRGATTPPTGERP